MSTLPPRHLIDADLLDRYFAKLTTAAESEEVQRWILSRPDHAMIAELLPGLPLPTEGSEIVTDTEAWLARTESKADRFANEKREWTRRRFSPWWTTYTILMIILGGAIGSLGTLRFLPSREHLSSWVARDTLHVVRFFLRDLPGATRVTLAGNFDGHGVSRTPLHLDRAHGMWWGTLALAPGEYLYRFVIDDTETVLDPHAPVVAGEGGRPASVVVIPARPGMARTRFPRDT